MTKGGGLAKIVIERENKKRLQQVAKIMPTYNIELVDGILKVGFGEPAQNDQIVRDAFVASEAVKEKVMGKFLRVNGPASLPVAMVICHAFDHIVPAIGVFDPKLQKYVVCVSHDPAYKVGDLVD